MSCGLVLASISLKEERKKRQQINKKKSDLDLLLLASPSYSFWSSCEKNVKNSVFSFYIPFCQVFLFSPHVQMETNVWWHIWGTLRRPGKKERAKIEAKKREERKEIGVCVYGSHCKAVCVWLQAEDCADVHAAAGLTHHSTRLKKKGFSPLCFKYHRPSKWARTCLRNK